MRPDIRILEIRSDVHHRYARTEVYSVVVNPAEESQEVIFKTVLPDEAFVSSFAITVGGRVYPARIEGREEARAEYQQAVRAGRTAAHVQQSARHAHLFTVALHVAARDKAAFNLTYEQLLAREQGRYRLRLMLDPGQVVQRLLVEARVRDSAPLTLVRVAKLRAADNEVDDAAEGPDDPLATVKRLAPGEALVRWEPDEEAQRQLASGEGLQGLLEVQYDVDHSAASQLLVADGGYFVHFFSLPDEELPPMAKHAVFLLDVSGSMCGRKIEQVREAMTAILSEIREIDTFSLLTFSTDTFVWVPGRGFLPAAERLGNAVVVASPEMVVQAQEAVSHLQDQASTHLYDALQAAYAAVRAGRQGGGGRQPLVILLTDGQPNGPNCAPDELLRAVTAATSDPATCAPLYSLAFGRDADFHLLKQLSLRGKGFARKIYEAADAALQLRNLYRRVASPLLADVTFHYADGQVEASSLTQAAFPVLLAGAELAVAGVGVGVGEGAGVGAGLRATVRGAARGRAPLERAAAVQRLEPQQASFVERLWAYLTVRQLLERADGGDEQAKERARELALRYAFVTSVTSLIVVKPDDQTGGADLRDADESPLPSPMGVPQSFCARFGGAPQLMCSMSLSQRGYASPARMRMSPMAFAPPHNFVPQRSVSDCVTDVTTVATSLSCDLECSDVSDSEDADYLTYSSLDNCTKECITSERDETIVRGDIKVLEIRSDVLHRYARTQVKGVLENPTDESQRLTFTAVLPDDAFLSGLEITVGGSTFPVSVVERREGAAAKHQQAAHVQLSARHAHLFTVALHVAARDKAAFNLTYEQLLAREQGRYRLRLMLDPGQVVQRLLVEARVRDSAPLTLVRVAKLRAADNEVDDAAEGPDNPLATVQRLAPGEALVRWEPDGEAQRRLASGDGVRGLLEIQYDVENTDTSQLLLSESGYFAHFFSLPESHPLMPKHVIFVIDVGHSMHDSKLQQVKEALSATLSELREGDAFSLVTFSAEARVWVRGLGFVEATEGRRNTVVAATSDMVLEAQEVVGQLQPQTTSGSRLLSALLAAQRAVREGRESAMGGAPRQPLILLLASGQEISERQKLLHAVTAATSDPITSAPLYSLAFDRDADFHLLKQLSLRGKGFARKIYEAADAALQLRNLYRRVASPLLADVTFHYADGQVEESSLTQAAFPVLLAGAELAVAGVGVGVGEGVGVGVGEGVGAGLRATVRGAARGRAPLERAAAVQRLEPQQASFVERLWAYLTVRQLLERADGGDPQAKERARELALRYAFVDPSAGTEFKSEDGKITFAYGSC